jgi:hypothetical protein
MFLRVEHFRINEVGTGSLTVPALALRHRPRLETRRTLPPFWTLAAALVVGGGCAQMGTFCTR